MYYLGFKLLPKEFENISIIYLCDFKEKEMEIINCLQFSKRTVQFSDIESYTDVFFKINFKTFFRIKSDYLNQFNFDFLSLKKFLIHYNLDEWAI